MARAKCFSKMAPKRIAVLVSGTGTNLQALLDAQQAGHLAPAELAVVVSNRPKVPALERAAKAKVPHCVVDHKAFSSRQDFEDELIKTLDSHNVEAVVLAGFMRILSDRFVGRFPNLIINTHPALCPAFPGINAPQQALDHGAKVTGCTVHFVDTGVDTGPIIIQEAVCISPDDTASALHARIQCVEHRLLPEATRLLALGKLSIDGRHVRVE